MDSRQRATQLPTFAASARGCAAPARRRRCRPSASPSSWARRGSATATASGRGRPSPSRSRRWRPAALALMHRPAHLLSGYLHRIILYSRASKPRNGSTAGATQTTGHKAMARPFLDGRPATEAPGRDGSDSTEHLGDGKAQVMGPMVYHSALPSPVVGCHSLDLCSSLAAIAVILSDSPGLLSRGGTMRLEFLAPRPGKRLAKRSPSDLPRNGAENSKRIAGRADAEVPPHRLARRRHERAVLQLPSAPL